MIANVNNFKFRIHEKDFIKKFKSTRIRTIVT